MQLRWKRRHYTAAESAEIWDRWRRGEGLKSIGRVFGKGSSSIFNHLAPHGGIRPRPRRRSKRALSLAEREELSRSLVHGLSIRGIAARLGACPIYGEPRAGALQNLRLDLLKLRSSGLESAMTDVASATQEARALSREIGNAVDAVREVRRL